MAGKRALVFLDASVPVAASHSPSGGSSVAIEVCQGRRFRAAVTHEVLIEARVNIAEKFSDAESLRFYQQLAELDPEVAPSPSPGQIAACVPMTTQKDAHVLAAALACRAEYLLTLDRRHLLTDKVLDAGLPIEVLTPGTFLKAIVRVE